MILWPANIAEQIRKERARGVTWAQLAERFGVSVATIRNKAIECGFLTPRKFRRFTPEEDAIIRADYMAHADLILTAERLGRSYGDVHQRIHRTMRDVVGTVRTAAGTRALRRYGSELLAHGATPDDAIKNLRGKIVAARAEAKSHAAEVKRKRRREKIDAMLAQIAAGANRNEAIFEARCLGASLQEIAEAIGVTRERIRQICDATAFRMAADRMVPESPRAEAAE